MISRVIAGKQDAGWDFCVGVAGPLGKDPVEVFRLAGLLPEESRGHDEPALLHLYRQLSNGSQSAALAMLRGLAGQQAPATQPPALRQAQDAAPGADIDAVCRMLARLDSSRLEMAAIFIKWLIEQPAAGPDESTEPTWEDVTNYFASLSPERLETVLTNLLRRFGRQAKNPDAPGDIHSEPPSESGRAPHQGSLF